ncbi:MAG: phosphatase PAP2 family protein [Gammaproteobacteria bacterium]|nr:phosphatase PAP2 family protein [Gammaproteobacteria bacterium]
MASYRIILPFVVLLTIMTTGCSTLSNGQRWGEDASFPSWEKLKSTAWNAARDPQTWVPLAGALVLSVGDLDEDLSDWAVRETPLFGSTSSADDASDDMRVALGVTALASALATPGGDSPAGEWGSSKLKGLLVETTAVVATSSVTSALKDATKRTRPNDRSDSSFPSAHASAAFSFATLTSRNVNTMHLTPVTKKVLRYSTNTVAVATAWARIEAEKHYPTDVLVGAALGHFLTAVIHDSAMGLDTPVQVGINLDGKNGGMLTFHMPF